MTVKRMQVPVEPRTRTIGEVIAAWGLSYGLCIGLLGALVYFAGIWNILANTRLLDVLIEGGIIRYHDLHQGLVDGVQDHGQYLMSQDPIDYRLVLVAALIYFAYWGFRGFKYHAVARFVGMKGSSGQHARAWLYGDGMGRFFPLSFGEAAVQSALEQGGEDPIRVRQSFCVVEYLTLVFQIGLFWIFGLFVTDYSLWFSQSLYAFVILAVTILVARRTGLTAWGGIGFWRMLGQVHRALAERPATFFKLGLIAAFLMLLDDITPFVMAMAFTGDNVILNVNFFVVQSGVVAGYIARRVPLTPHGIGQWEWAFALALYVSGMGFPEAATIALLDSLLRHTTGLIVWLAIRLGGKVPTNFSTVMASYMRAPVDESAGEGRGAGGPALAGEEVQG